MFPRKMRSPRKCGSAASIDDGNGCGGRFSSIAYVRTMTHSRDRQLDYLYTFPHL